jgi:hypothetical protein
MSNLTNSECLCPTCKSCLSDQMVKKIKSFEKELNKNFIIDGNQYDRKDVLLPKDMSDKSQLIRRVAERLDCKSESCILRHPLFELYTSRNGAGGVDEELKQNFKSKGDRYIPDWLNNHEIDNVMNNFKLAFPNFYPYKTQSIDFSKIKSELGKYDTPKLLKKYNQIGCVINTDYHWGGGIHWLCVFIDAINGTIEFFNSGKKKYKQIIFWMIKTKLILKKHYPDKIFKMVLITEIEHQKYDSECGMFSLYYIWERLNGRPYTWFNENEITDLEVFKVRRKFFRDF